MKVFACFDFAHSTHLKDVDWFTKWLGHCYVVIPLTDDKCLMMDSTTKGFLIKPFECNALDLIKNLEQNAIIVYGVNVKREVNTAIEICNCTGFVKKVLNINKFWIQTPRQLMRYIHGLTELSSSRG